MSGTRLVKTPGDQNVSALGEQTQCSVLMQVLLSILHKRVIVWGREEETEGGGSLRGRRTVGKYEK